MLEIKETGCLWIIYEDGKQLNKKNGRVYWFLTKRLAEKALKKLKEEKGTWYNELLKEPEKPKSYLIKTVNNTYEFYGKLHQTKVYARRITKKGWFAVYYKDELIYEAPKKA